MEKKDINYFILKARSVHGGRYDYSRSIYNNSKSKIEIICKIHGSFLQTVSDHYAGYGCPYCNGSHTSILTHDEFCTIVNEKLPNIKIIGKYRGTKYKILVEDELGFEYNVVALMLLQGKIPTIKTAVDKSAIYKYKANIVHCNKYNYDNTYYKNSRSKISISCPIHGEFIQNANSHLKGSECPLCSRNKTNKSLSNRPMDWTLSGWISSAEVSTSFDSYKVYIIEVSGNNEKFIKIGRTYRSVKDRFYDRYQFPYDYKIIKEISDNPHRIFKLEHKLHKIVRSFRYIPKISFHGMNECFTPDCLELLKDYINKE